MNLVTNNPIDKKLLNEYYLDPTSPPYVTLFLTTDDNGVALPFDDGRYKGKLVEKLTSGKLSDHKKLLRSLGFLLKNQALVQTQRNASIINTRVRICSDQLYHTKVEGEERTRLQKQLREITSKETSYLKDVDTIKKYLKENHGYQI